MVDVLRQRLAESLLNIEAVILNPSNPFTWSSGLKSPIYCDNRLTMSYPEVREDIANGFVELIQSSYPDVEVIAGTSTAGIPHAAWVSQKLNLPMVYVRGKAKSHGKKKQIEGKLEPGSKVVIIEDLISTGGSSLTTYHALKEGGAEVLGVAAIFTYGLPSAQKNFEEVHLPFATLTDFDVLLELGVHKKIINTTERQQLLQWHSEPESEAWLHNK